MADEKSKFSDHSGVPQAAYRIGSPHPSSDSSSTPLARFFKRVGEIFNPIPATDSKLGGRIIEMQTTADQALHDLMHFKKTCEKNIDPCIFVIICSLIDPVIKELVRLQSDIKRSEGATKQVKTFSRYTALIDKARFWIHLGTDHKGGLSIRKAVVQQTIQDFHDRIDRDIQLIEDYLTHALNGIEVEEVLKIELRSQLMPSVSPTILRLYQLREAKQEPTLDSLVLWRSTADHTRENLFGAALHVVDTFFSDFLPAPATEKESELVLLLLAQLVHLEEKITGISELVSHKGLDGPQRSVTIVMLDRLEEDAHELNRNLRLSHEHSERVQHALETILNLRAHLS